MRFESTKTRLSRRLFKTAEIRRWGDEEEEAVECSVAKERTRVRCARRAEESMAVECRVFCARVMTVIPDVTQQPAYVTWHARRRDACYVLLLNADDCCARCLLALKHGSTRFPL